VHPHSSQLKIPPTVLYQRVGVGICRKTVPRRIEHYPYAHGYRSTNVVSAFERGTNPVNTWYHNTDPAFLATFEIPGHSVTALVQGLILFRCEASRAVGFGVF
jgi:hypothetical protein